MVKDVGGTSLGVSDFGGGGLAIAGIGFIDWLVGAIDNLVSSKAAPQRASGTAVTVQKGDINWDPPENTKKHIANGSGVRGRYDWGKFNLDPKDPNFWTKLVPLLKAVDEFGEKTKEFKVPTGIVLCQEYFSKNTVFRYCLNFLTMQVASFPYPTHGHYIEEER